MKFSAILFQIFKLLFKKAGLIWIIKRVFFFIIKRLIQKTAIYV